MAYSHKTRQIFGASLTASQAFDEAHEAVHDEIVEKADDYGECPLCGATMYYGMDYTHEDDCPAEIVSEMHNRFQDALIVLDDAIANRMEETGRGNELREHPLDAFARTTFEKLTKSR